MILNNVLSLTTKKSRCENIPSFSPEDLPNLKLWLDASDASTVTESGGKVSQWDDKSGLGNHATQVVASFQPEYLNLNSLVFSDDFMDLAGLQKKEAFIVVSDAKSSNANSLFSDGLTSQNYTLLRSGTSIDYTISVDGAVNNSGSVSINNSDRYTGGNIAVPGYVPFPNTTDKIVINVDYDNSYTLKEICKFTTTQAELGKITIHEIIVTSGIISVEDRLKTYNYLSSKWGV